MWLLFDARVEDRFGGSIGTSLTYVPIVFMALVALLWGTRGATLAAFLGALIAIVNTAQAEGPFAGVEGFLGEAKLEVQGYALAIALDRPADRDARALRNAMAMRAARDWQTRFEATIGAHRLLAYEWDPASGRLAVTGDARAPGRRAGDAARHACRTGWRSWPTMTASAWRTRFERARARPRRTPTR